MNLNVLSAERFEEGQYGQRRSIDQGTGGSLLWGGLLASGEAEENGSSSPIETRPRISPKNSSSKTGSGEDSGTRQRGRPRLDTRDKTAAEVGLSFSLAVSGAQSLVLLPRHVKETVAIVIPVKNQND